ncbi:MAG: peptidoglycan DD-metalloendopeptidase family protein [Gammaproteobacteria bacterium]|nr:peptidoglycan DD-metalloendopeptidase family protein [Gammaproteobacteria bacterium]
MKIFVAALLLSFSLTAPFLASASQESEQRNTELKRLSNQIDRLSSQINSQKKKRGLQQQQLKKAEQLVSRLNRKISQQKQKIRQQSRALKKLKQRQQHLNQQLKQQRATLARQLRAAHRIGEQQTLRLFFNQQDPSSINRTLTLATYLTQTRTDNIKQLNQLSQELQQLKQTSLSTSQLLARTHAQLLTEKKELKNGQKNRKEALVAINRTLNSDKKRLTQLKQQQRQLERLLQSLSERLADIPLPPMKKRPFAKLKGKLPWPTRGRIVIRYGTPRGLGDLRWRGMIIKAPRGQHVHNVYYGQVVFADWLQGFGNIIIIDHGNHYMSLYGHNQSLLKESGDWVQPNDVIATVGDTGGQSRTGVYFEIRRRGTPLNPRPWLQKQPSTARR